MWVMRRSQHYVINCEGLILMARVKREVEPYLQRLRDHDFIRRCMRENLKVSCQIV